MAFVQATSVQSSVAATSGAITPQSKVGSGNLMALFVTWYSTTQSIASVSDTTGNVFNLVTKVTLGDSNMALYWSNCDNGGSDTITFAFSGSVTGFIISYSEYSNFSGSVFGFTVNSGTLGVLSAGPLQLGVGNVFLVSSFSVKSGASTTVITGPFATRTSSLATFSSALADYGPGPTGGVSAFGTGTANVNWVGIMAGFNSVSGNIPRVTSGDTFGADADNEALSDLDNSLMLPVNVLNDSSFGYVNGVLFDVGIANAYSVTANFGSPQVYREGMTVSFIPLTQNSSGATLSVNGLMPIQIVSNCGLPLTGGEISANSMVTVVYSGGNFWMLDTSRTFNFPVNTIKNSPIRMNCLGARRVHVDAVITTIFSTFSIFLYNVCYGTNVIIRFANSSSASSTLLVNGTIPGGVILGNVSSFESGNGFGLNTPGRPVASGHQYLFNGMTGIFTSGTGVPNVSLLWGIGMGT